MKCQCDMIQYAREGIASLTPDAVNDIKNFLSNQLNSDGGFADRDGASDIYYTVFGIQLYHALKMNTPKTTQRYLEKLDFGENLDFVHLASLVRCIALIQVKNKALTQELISQIESFRSRDGGFNHQHPEAEKGTAYAAFLAYLAYSESGLEIPEQDSLLLSLAGLRRNDFSYANDPEMESGATTATAAAIVLLHDLGGEVPEETLEALRGRQHSAGGFLAGPVAPVPDLLSAATALLALKTADKKLTGINTRHQEFVSSLWNEDGGFSGQIFDGTSDVEYTFYALLVLGILSR